MLAIVIPYFKINFFEETLLSLKKQTNKKFCVYIGNDYSPENPELIIDKYSEDFEIIYKKFDTNLGSKSLTQQWERCVNLIENEKWFMILGDDDYLSENLVEEFYANCTNFENKSNVVRFATKVIDENGKFISNTFENPLIETGIDYITRKLKGKTRGSLSEFIFNKKEFLKYNFTNYPSAFYSDDKIVLDLSSNKNIFSINKAMVFVRISSLSLSGQANYNNDKLQYAKYDFFNHLINYHFHKFPNDIKKKIAEESLLLQQKLNKINLFKIIKIQYLSFITLDYKLFIKIVKKSIKVISNKPIE